MEVNNQKCPTVPGFTPPSFVRDNDYRMYVQNYDKVLDRREQRWNKYFLEGAPKKSSRLKRFCRKGIPALHRPSLWMYLSGADDRMMRNPGVYVAAASGKPPVNILNVILVDVPRTFPENIHFQNPDDPRSKLQSLERVLTAFAVQFPEVGYCQGMNYIAAILLLVMCGTVHEVEERAFWLLDALINHILPPYYSSEMQAVHTDCMVFQELLKSKVPDVYRVILDAEISCTLLATKWFICLFVDVLPVETTLRLFDCLFYEGDKVLFRACITLVKLHHVDILKCKEFPSVITTFRNMCCDKQTLYCHEFMKSMFKLPGTLSRAQIRVLRRKFSESLSDEQD